MMKELTPSDLAHHFDTYVYSTLLNHFGEATKDRKRAKKEHRSDKIDTLRQKKKELKKERKELHKKGLKGSAADKLITQKWFATMREHSRLTRSFREREAVIRNCQQQKQFKKNPMRFGKQLFQNKTSGEPGFLSHKLL